MCACVCVCVCVCVRACMFMGKGKFIQKKKKQHYVCPFLLYNWDHNSSQSGGEYSLVCWWMLNSQLSGGRGGGQKASILASFCGINISTLANFKISSMQLGRDACNQLSVAKWSEILAFFPSKLFIYSCSHINHINPRTNFWLRKIVETNIYRMISVLWGVCTSLDAV